MGWKETKEILSKYETKIIIAVGLILVAVISFEAGFIKGKAIKENPIIIEKTCPAVSCENTQAQAKSDAPTDKKTETIQVADTSSTENKNCAYVGSKNSNKYHLPSCQWAKRIKPENIVCFRSAEDAVAKGYQPDKTCNK